MAMRLFLFAAMAIATTAAAPLVKTLNGTYLGRYVPSLDQDFFLGMPFAHAPRLANPTPYNESWTDVRSAEWYGPICHQSSTLTPERIARTNISGVAEQCLNLNVVRPSGHDVSKNGKLPVVVWLHGGGFVNGFGADLNSNFSYVVKQSVEMGTPILAVTINYRLGLFGFPFGDEVREAGVANLGLKDQRVALRWVQENIEAFGGDRDKVTLWGQSAGAFSIVGQLLAYGGRDDGLFHRVLPYSGGLGIANAGNVTRADRLKAMETIAKATGCEGKGLACLRAVDAHLLSEAGNNASTLSMYWSAVDGDFLREVPSIQLLRGDFPKKLKILTGSNSDEGLAFLGSIPEVNTEDDVANFLRRYFPQATNETLRKLLAAYPVEAGGPPFSLPADQTDWLCQGVRSVGMRCSRQSRRVAAIVGDYLFLAGRRTLARAAAERGMIAYSYRFDTWPLGKEVQNGKFRPGYASHSTEYSYFLGYGREHTWYEDNPVVANSSAHRALSHGIVTKLISFVHSGDPNAVKAPGFPTWPKYSVEMPSNLVFNATEEPDVLNVHVEADTFREEGFRLFETYPYELDFPNA